MEEKTFYDIATCPPSVFAIEDEYQIFIPVGPECTMWVEAGGETYFDHSNGIMRSKKFMHSVRLPMSVLDRAKEYTIYLREIIERKPYFTETGSVVSMKYAFRPVDKDKKEIKIINIADAHSYVDEPIKSASFFKNGPDILILNGDIPNHSGDIEYFRGIYRISGTVTGGMIPCVFSRGNHDLRGLFAEVLADYTPTYYGRSYYTFRLGPVWGIVIDCGEDKPDDNEEYGNTVCCHAFREEETEFIKKTVEEKEYEKYEYRIICVHHPFTTRMQPKFNIEYEIYSKWGRLLSKIDANCMISGHIHSFITAERKTSFDEKNQPAFAIVASGLGNDPEHMWHKSGAIILKGRKITAICSDSRGYACEIVYKKLKERK